MAEIIGFSAEHVCRLTGLSLRQLAYWDKTGFFAPEYASENRRSPYARVYSFRDVVGLRTIALLLKKHHVSLQELRRTARWLSDYSTELWSKITFYVGARRVYFDDPRSGARHGTRTESQTVLPVVMEQVIQDARQDVEQMRIRRDEQLGTITQHRYIAHNAPVLDGTRIPTSAVWNLHRAGYAAEAIQREYPTLTSKDIEAAIAFEADRHHMVAG